MRISNYHSDFKISEHSSAEIFDEANRNFKLIKRTGIQKYRNLEKWSYTKSIHLVNEVNLPKTNKKVYQRGAIIYVDFGINIGGEFSMPHFAIVLNKSDNRNNEKLTVVPLTSHVHNHTVKLSNTITDSSIRYLKKSLIEMEEFVISQRVMTRKFESELSDRKPSFFTIFNEIDPRFTKNVKESIKSFNDAERYIKKFINIREKVAIEKISNETILEYILGEKQQNINDELDAFSTVFEKYMKYNKDTYARLEDITTISKRRIRKINRFDPIGQIKVSTATLDIIDENIKKLFIGKNID